MAHILEVHLQDPAKERALEQKVLELYRESLKTKRIYKGYHLIVVTGPNLKERLHDFTIYQVEMKEEGSDKEILLAGWAAATKRGLTHMIQEFKNEHFSYWIVGP